MPSGNGLNYLFLKRAAHLLHVFFPLSHLSINVQLQRYQERFYSHPIFLLFLILLCESALQFIIYLVGLLPSSFIVELSKSPDQRDFAGFRWLIARAFGLVILNALLKSLSTFLSTLLYVKWRMRLVLYLHSFYFTKSRYYHLSSTTQRSQLSDNEQSSTVPNIAIRTNDVDDQEHEAISYTPATDSHALVGNKLLIDNPDQRIVQDADSLCRTLSQIIPLLLISPFVIGYYMYRTWQITGFYGPLALVINFILWSLINKVFISFVSRTIFEQNIAEGNFRFLHSQIRTHHEPIAFYHGDTFEHKRFDGYFMKTLAPILYRRTRQQFLLSLTTNLYDYIGSIITYLLLALVIFVFHLYDHLPMAELVRTVSQTSFVAGYLIFRFNLLNDLSDQVTIIAANTHRIETFVEYMKNMTNRWSDYQTNRSMQQNEVLCIKNLTYSTPTNHHHVLMKNLNLTLKRGDRLLITGDSGVGKTSLFRVLHSLWPVNIHGSFSYRLTDTYLLPQRPYFTNLSLHDELSYPDANILPSIERQRIIVELLEEWNLSHILEYVESNIHISPEYAWQDLLSPGELQRLSFIRLLLRLSSPSDGNSSRIGLVFLDEITSSLDGSTEMKMYRYLVDSNLSLISIGHRETLRQYHQYELKLFRNGEYTLGNIQS